MKRFLMLPVLFMVICSCTPSDDNSPKEQWLRGVEGIVSHTESCQASNGSLPYRINLSDGNTGDWIIAPNLPKEFRSEELKVKFDMINTSSGFGACVMIFSPDVFYELDNVKIYQSTGKN